MKEDKSKDKDRRHSGKPKDEGRAGHDGDHKHKGEHEHRHEHHARPDHFERHRPSERDDPPHRGRGGPRGEFPREPRDRARRGEARFLLLDALRDGPKHGYEIIKAMEERSAGGYVPSPGTVYPTLQFLEDQALVRADSEGERRVFALTDAGKTELAAREDDVKAFWSRFTPNPATAATRHEVGFLQEALDDLNRTIWRGLRDAMEQGDQAAIRGVRESIEQCRNDVRRIIADASTVTEAAPAQKNRPSK